MKGEGRSFGDQLIRITALTSAETSRLLCLGHLGVNISEPLSLLILISPERSTFDVGFSSSRCVFGFPLINQLINQSVNQQPLQSSTVSPLWSISLKEDQHVHRHCSHSPDDGGRGW